MNILFYDIIEIAVQCDMNISNDSDSISTQSTNLEISKTTSQNQSIMKFIDTTKEIEKVSNGIIY